MKSNADIIYNHTEKQKGDFVVPIEIDNNKNLQYINISFNTSISILIVLFVLIVLHLCYYYTI